MDPVKTQRSLFVSGLKEWWFDLKSLVFPQICPGCGKMLQKGEGLLCLRCRMEMPETGFHLDANNPVMQKFRGRLPLRQAASLYYFHKSARVQHVLHKLKYDGRKDIGTRLGIYYGHQLRNTPGFHSVQVVIPVPLYPAKEHKRGFNQSAAFAEGIAAAMDILHLPHFLTRTINTESQTGKSKLERWENVRDVFSCPFPGRLRGKHVLLVDDVVTTGSTLEACALTLLRAVPRCTLSLATIACAD